MALTDRKAVRITGIALLLLAALSVSGMAMDGVIEWQLRRNNPVGNAVGLTSLGMMTVTGLFLLISPRFRDAYWQRLMLGLTLLLFALEQLTGLLSGEFLARGVTVLSVLVVIFSLLLAAFFGRIGIGIMRMRDEEVRAQPGA